MSKQKKEFDKIVRILIISGIVLIVSGVLIVAFVSDLERKPLVVNSYGAFLVILGIFSFVAIGWRNWIKTGPSELESVAKNINDVKSKKKFGKVKPALILIGILLLILYGVFG